MDSIMFRRGFLCYPENAEVKVSPEVVEWQSFECQGWVLRAHPEVPTHVYRVSASVALVAVGDIFVAHGEKSLEWALERLATGNGDIVEDLSGKFAILLFIGDDLVVLNDPLGSQGVYYRPGSAVVGSHAALVAQALSLGRSHGASAFMSLSDHAQRATKFLPGDLTMFNEVLMLIPNNELDVRSGITRRYWPRVPFAESSTQEAAAVWDEYFSNYAKYIDRNYRAVLGVTGGTDSRSIIASLRSKGLRLDYETWERVSSGERSRIEAMVEYLGGRHRWISTSGNPNNKHFAEVVNAAASAGGFARGGANLVGRIAEGSEPRQLFIYGHGTGVMRGSFNTEVKPWLPKDALKLAYYLYAGPARKGASAEFRRFVMNAFNSFLVRGNYGDGIVGADIGDLLYWESRMANWASPMIAAHTIATNAHAGFNSRRLFLKFWGIHETARHDKSLNRDIARGYDAELAAM